MSTLKYLLTASVIGAGILVGVGAGAGHATATTDTTQCHSVRVNDVAGTQVAANQLAYSFNINDQARTATADVKAGSGCVDKEISLVSYTATGNVHPPEIDQHIFDSVTKTTSTNVKTLSVKLPGCFYQVDLVWGKPLDLSTGATYHDTKSVIKGATGGSTACVTGQGGASTPPAATTTSTTLPETGNNGIEPIIAVFSLLGAAVALRKYKVA